MATQGARSDWNCSSCDSSDVFCEGGKVFECQACGDRIHEAIIEYSGTLANLADRNDKAGAIAQHLLETGGVRE